MSLTNNWALAAARCTSAVAASESVPSAASSVQIQTCVSSSNAVSRNGSSLAFHSAVSPAYDASGSRTTRRAMRRSVRRFAAVIAYPLEEPMLSA